MAASQYHFNKGVFKVLKSYNRISLETFSIQILFFKNHLNSKSKENFLNIQVYGGFFINLYSACFLRTKEIVKAGALSQPRIVFSLLLTFC